MLRRLGGRWSCPECSAVFHEVFSPPQSAGSCDRCPGALIQRGDDQPKSESSAASTSTLSKRAPLIDYYERSGKLRTVDGERGPDAVGADLLAALRGNGGTD